MIGTILVPLDGSLLAERALPYATKLARATSARLVLAHARSSASVTREQPAEIAVNDELGDIAEKIRASGLEVETQVRPIRDEDVAGAIVETIREQAADLVVMSTHGHNGLGRWLWGGVADGVIRKSTAPIVVVSAVCEQYWSGDRPMRILVPLDGSPLAEEALYPARELATALGGELILVRVVGPLEHFVGNALPLLEGRRDAELSEAQMYLEALAGKARASELIVETVVELGASAGIITNIARNRKVDLIAMATHGRSGLARLTMGSVATGVLHQAHVPLLVMRPAKIRQEAAELIGAAAGASTDEDVWRPALD